MSGYRVLICGSRDWDDRNAIWAVLWGLETLHDDQPLTVIEGGARGADRHAWIWCRTVAAPTTAYEQYPADWQQHGKAAGPIRNQVMIEEGKPDVVWAFVTKPLEESRGTHDMVQRAKAAGIPRLCGGQAMTTTWVTAAAVPDPPQFASWRDMATVRSISRQSGLHLGGDMPNEMAWRAWLDLMRRRRLSQNTIRLRDWALHDLWADLGSRGKTWRQIDPEDLDGWLGRVCRPRKRNGGRPLQPSSRNTYARAALCFYRFAAARGLLERNPLDEVVPPRRPGPRPRALPVASIGELLMVVDPRVRMMILLGYHQALRISEIVRLCVGDVAFSNDPPMLRIVGKGGVERWMPLSPLLRGEMHAWLVHLAAAHRFHWSLLPEGLPLIPNFRFPGSHLSAAYAAHLLAAAMRPMVGDSGHALRHTAAQQLRRLTHDPFIVRDALGHTSLEMQSIYVGADPELLAAALAKLPVTWVPKVDPLQEAR